MQYERLSDSIVRADGGDGAIGRQVRKADVSRRGTDSRHREERGEASRSTAHTPAQHAPQRHNTATTHTTHNETRRSHCGRDTKRQHRGVRRSED